MISVLLALCFQFQVCPPELTSWAETWTPPPPVTSPHFHGMGSNTEQWRGLVEAHWPDELVDTAMCLMEYESGGNPWAKNPTSSARGLMQIMGSVWAEAFGVSYHDLYDPHINIRLAYQIYLRQGWWAWAPYVRGECRV